MGYTKQSTILILLAILSSVTCFTIRNQRALHGFKSNNYQSKSIIGMKINTIDVDVAVIGGGIGGSTISWVLQQTEKCSVIQIDPRINVPGSFYPNYGAWRREWHTVSDRLNLPELKDATTTEWELTDCFFGGSNDVPMDKRTTLAIPYVRVDKVKMEELLRRKFVEAGGILKPSKLSSTRISPNLFDKNIIHTAKGSILTLDDGTVVNCKVLVDSTGSESRIVAKETPSYARGSEKELVTGYQIAYGFIALIDKLESYDEKAMTLFDYRLVL